jgi:hypothetical protein
MGFRQPRYVASQALHLRGADAHGLQAIKAASFREALVTPIKIPAFIDQGLTHDRPPRNRPGLVWDSVPLVFGKAPVSAATSFHRKRTVRNR